jgi:hypothetical protein
MQVENQTEELVADMFRSVRKLVELMTDMFRVVRELSNNFNLNS